MWKVGIVQHFAKYAYLLFVELLDNPIDNILINYMNTASS